jgi:hypothetical protein
VTSPKPGPDWSALAQRLQREMANLTHHDAVKRYGDDFYAEALRRTFGAREPHGHIPYATISTATGLTTVAESDWTRESHTVVDRLNAEDARRQAKEARAEAQRVMRDAARDLAKYLRGRCNERRVPARLRREGVLLAADWIDPDQVTT